MPTRSLRSPPPRFPLEIHPLARLDGDRLELLSAAFPPLGPATIVLWRPGEDPAFALLDGAIDRGWRWTGPRATGHVVLWARREDPAKGS